MSDARPVLVLHDAGDEGAGAPWAAALGAAGWPGEVCAPDLPGHGTAPAPTDGAYELVDAAFAVLPALHHLGAVRPVVIGVGANGWAAQVLALAGRASALVLVDGLGGPWRTPVESIADERERLRAIFDDPSAIAPAPEGVLDPRLRHGSDRQSGLGLARRAAATLAVPVLVLESPGSVVGPARADLVRRIAVVATADVPSPEPSDVSGVVVAWASGLAPQEEVSGA